MHHNVIRAYRVVVLITPHPNPFLHLLAIAVMPAQAGISSASALVQEMPACAGMTVRGDGWGEGFILLFHKIP